MSGLLVESIIAVVGGVLLFAGAAKIATPEPTATTLTNISGLSPEWAIRAAILLGAAELVGATIVTVVRGLPAAVSLVGFGTAFAIVGYWALKQGKSISCSCYGRRGGNSVLGFRQVLALPLWLASAVLLAGESAESFAASLLSMAIATGLALAAVSWELIPRIIESRSARLAMRPLR